MRLFLANDPELLARFTRWYKRNHWNEALSLSQQFLKKVDGITLAAPDKTLVVLLECLNKLKPYGGKFEVLADKLDKKGNAQVRFVQLKHIAQ